MHIRRSRYLRHRVPPEIISHAVWLYHRDCLSFRDVEDLLAERGIIVSYETIRQWCGKFGPDYARRLKRRQGRLGDTWFLDGIDAPICQDTRSGGLDDLLASTKISHDALVDLASEETF